MVQNENHEKNTVWGSTDAVAATCDLPAEPSEPELVKSRREC